VGLYIGYKSGQRNTLLKLNQFQLISFGAPLVVNLSENMPSRYHVGSNATAVLSIGSLEGGRSFGMENLLTRGSFLVAAATPAS
jgi:hypothetical protein